MSDQDRVHLETKAERKGESRWAWAVWVEGSAAALDLLASVRYVLHPTFPNPIRIVEDRKSKFRLESAGWGEFAIEAEVTRNDGRTFRLERWLDLGFQEGREGADRKPRVFLSFGAADAPWARAVKEELTKQGVDVVSPQDMVAGTTITSAISESLQGADLVAFMTNGELRGFAEIELDKARERQKPCVPILVGRDASLPAQFDEKIQPVHMYTQGDSLAVADALRARVIDLTYQD
jgi:hypothetical protein